MFYKKLKNMIKIKNLEIWVWDKKILKWISFDIKIWKNYWLLGKNWSWKSSLALFLMWHPKYQYLSWKVELNWIDLNKMSSTQRSKSWLFLSFQNIPEISWITLNEYLRTIYNISLKNKNPDVRELSPFIFKRFIKKYLQELSISESFLNRELNVWFSWWEKRKIEILQMKLIWPKYIILDEIDSWLDLDAFKMIASLLKNISNKNNSLIIISHNFKIFDYIWIDEVLLLKDWKIIKKGNKSLIDEISEKGFE